MESTTKENGKDFSRRDFLKVSAAAGAGVLFSGSVLANTFSSLSSKKRFAVVGTGHRTELWQGAIYNEYKDTCEVVGLCDTNPGRGQRYQEMAQKLTGKTPPFYEAKEFDKMISETKPHTVIVTTMDSTHDYYICRAMELGCDVITEKPMTNTAERCQRIVDAQNKLGKTVTVTFNYRYSPPRTQVKDLLMS
ncbi:MAG: Gfo/Idh/MocA family oxidoreductase, partial [Ignavibacteria bacterium]|nr:Gfo/Idh/MocA family oxidoreductase [Ignavibacteria bacterium]